MGEVLHRLRVMTYNVHSCRGIDGRVHPERIAKVIKAVNPDILALQELDVNRTSTHRKDQPLILAEILRMTCHFQPALALEGEHYGIAVLSRHPFEILKAGHLPVSRAPIFPNNPPAPLSYLYEQREAIVTAVRVQGRRVIFCNTHLGLRQAERLGHIQTLLGEDWLGPYLTGDEPMIFCGDLNAGGKSAICEQILQSMDSVIDFSSPQSLRKTFPSFLPFRQLDHIFYSGALTLEKVHRPNDFLTRSASDHLPLAADFILE